MSWRRRTVPERGWCHIEVKAERWRLGQDRETWAWLSRALKQIGMPIGGWSYKGTGGWGNFRFTARGDANTFKRAVEDLWENERPGGGIEVRIGWSS
jgi:hypothetical protein